MWSLRVTIYEFLGYLVPGSILLAAITIAAWATFFPAFPLQTTPPSLSKEETVLVVLVAYLLGHAVQGICNLHPSCEKLAEKNGKHDVLLQAAKEALRKTCKTDLNELNIRQFAALAQSWLLHTGKTDDHDVFVYREGFYRGSSASFLLLAAALFFKAFRPPTNLMVAARQVAVPNSAIICIASLSFVCAVLFYRRYVRFGDYRLANLLAFACIPIRNSPAVDEKGSKSTADIDIGEAVEEAESAEGEE